MPRRVYGQVVATKSIYDTTAANAKTVMDTVTTARAKIAEAGKTYDESDILVLKQSSSGKVKSPTPLHQYVADIYGNINSIGANAISLQDTTAQSTISSMPVPALSSSSTITSRPMAPRAASPTYAAAQRSPSKRALT